MWSVRWEEKTILCLKLTTWRPAYRPLFLPVVQSWGGGDTQKEPQTWIQASNNTFRGRKSSMRSFTHPPEERESSWVITTRFGARPGKVEATALTLILTTMVTLVHMSPACSHLGQSYNEISHFRHFWILTLRLSLIWAHLLQMHLVQIESDPQDL